MIRPLTRPVARIVGDRMIITLTREGIYMRERGRRRDYGPLPYGLLLLQAAREYAEGVRAAKRRKGRNGVRRARLSIGMR